MKKHHRHTLVATAIGAVFAGSVDAATVFTPAQPKAYQPVHATIDVPTCREFDGVSFNGTQIIVQISSGICGTPPPGTVPLTVPLGRLPAGTWAVALKDGAAAAAPATNVTVAASAWFDETAFPALDVSGVWGVGDRPGHGVTFTQATNGELAGIAFTYLDTREPTFFTLQGGARLADGTWQGLVFKTTAAGLSGPAMPNDVTQVEIIGSAALEFDSPTTGELCLTLSPAPPNPPTCLPLVRYPFN